MEKPKKPVNSVLGLVGAKKAARKMTVTHEVKVFTRKKEKLLGKAEDLDDDQANNVTRDI